MVGALRWLGIALALAGVAFGVGYLLSTQVLFPAPDTAGTGIPTPELYGLDVAEARERVAAAGLTVGAELPLSSLEAPAGEVLAQDPLPGQQLRRGAAVEITVSAGPPVLRIPPLVGLSDDEARGILEAVGFGVETEPTRSELPAGVVARLRPEAGTNQQLPATVTLLVSVGPPLVDSAAVDTAGPDGVRGAPSSVMSGGTP